MSWTKLLGWLFLLCRSHFFAPMRFLISSYALHFRASPVPSLGAKGASCSSLPRPHALHRTPLCVDSPCAAAGDTGADASLCPQIQVPPEGMYPPFQSSGDGCHSVSVGWVTQPRNACFGAIFQGILKLLIHRFHFSICFCFFPQRSHWEWMNPPI